MTNHTADTTHTGPGNAPDAAVAALVAAVELIIKTFAGGVPFGTAADVLERIKAVRDQMDQLTFAMLAPLAQMESSGELLHEGGQKSLKAYLTHAWGIPHNEAKRLMELAQNLHKETLPETAAAIEDGALTVGEAASIASGVQRQVDKRDRSDNPDEELYRAKLDHGLANLKRVRPATSVQTLDRTAHALGLKFNPNQPEKNEEREFAARGARLHTTFGGSFTFEAWGPASDGERLKAALASFTAPYGTTDKTPTNGVGAEGATAFGGTCTNGADIGIGLIPAGESVTARYARTYDALISATGFAHGHHGHGTTNDNGHGNGFAGANNTATTAAIAAADADGDADTAADAGTAGAAATGGPAAGTDAGAGPGGDAADYAEDLKGPEGFAYGGGCSQPPGTKAVINITVPLSALLGFGFAFKKNENETDANNANANADAGAGAESATATAPTAAGTAAGANGTAGAATAGTATTGFATAVGANTTGAKAATAVTGANIAPGPEPGAETGADSGTYTGPGSPGVPGYAASPGVAMTEDGNVLALSAVRAMLPTAQIRRLIFDDRTGLPLDLGRAHRLAPGYLRTAAFADHTTCAWSGGCDVPVSQCEADHITEFTHGGTTTAANLQPLCSTHNRLKYRRTKTE